MPKQKDGFAPVPQLVRNWGKDRGAEVPAKRLTLYPSLKGI